MIVNVTIKTPVNAQVPATIFPRIELGATSPYPIRESVRTQNQNASTIDWNGDGYPSD